MHRHLRDPLLLDLVVDHFCGFFGALKAANIQAVKVGEEMVPGALTEVQVSAND